MWWAERRRPTVLLVLRAGSLAAHWHPQGLAAAPLRSWQLPLEQGASGPVAGSIGGATGDGPAGQAVAVLAPALRSLAAAMGGPPVAGAAPVAWRVLAAEPWLHSVALPWHDDLMQPAAASALARAALADSGIALHEGAVVQLDLRPPRGRPRQVLHAAPTLVQTLQPLVTAQGGRLCSLQPLVAAAAAWAARQAGRRSPAGGVALAVLTGASLHLVQADGEAAAGQALVDAAGPAQAAPGQGLPTSGGPPDLAATAARLWQRARWRYPALAQGGPLPLLSLDDAPPAAGPGAAPVAAPVTGTAQPALAWLPWPGRAVAGGAPSDRAALDLALARQARRDRLPDLLAAPAGAWQQALPWATAACLLAAGVAAAAAWRQQTAPDAPPWVAESPRAAAPVGRPLLAELQAAQAAVRQINLDPLPVLSSLLPPRDIPVQLWSLDLASMAPADEAGAARPADASAPRVRLRLQLAAPDATDMTRYLAFLADQPGVSALRLQRHQIEAEGDAGSARSGGAPAASPVPGRAGQPAAPASPAPRAPARTAYRFAVELTWQP